ncbi:MAG: MerR family transcriptional regulator [Syntrophobacterales bacterium]|nr:MAG: MerR family transcriptional regulator [Syntrophobacterales bacterium]
MEEKGLGQSIPDKLYYKIGEVSKITGVKPHVLRYWESEFKEIKPYKSQSLQRLYRKRDIELILRIKKLLYEDLFTISGAKRNIKDSPEKTKQTALQFNKEAYKKIFMEIKKELKEITQSLK